MAVRRSIEIRAASAMDFQYSETIAGLFHVRSQSSGKTESVRMEGTEPIFDPNVAKIGGL